MPNPVIEHVFVDNVTYDVKDIYAERSANKVSTFQENETNDRYPSALLVKTLLDQKASAGNLVTSFDSVPSDSKYPSEKLVKNSLDAKEDLSHKVTEFQDTPTHIAYPSEKLVKDALDDKEDNWNKTASWGTVPNDQKYPTEKLVYDSLQAQRTIVVTTLPRVDLAVETCDYILKNGTAGVLYKVIDGEWAPVGASNAKVLDELPVSGDVYTDYYVQNESGVYLHYRWDGTEFYEVGSDAYSKTQADAKFEVLDNKVSAFQATPTDTAYPTEKLVYDTLSGLQSTLTGAINSSTTVVNSLPDVASADANRNYVLLQGSGALMYRVINGAWKMIGGAMVSVVDELPQDGDAFTDYYVATEDEEIYLHYRWVDGDGNEDGHFYAVGADAYSKAEVDAMFTTDRNRITIVEGTTSSLAGRIDTVEAQLTSFDNMVDNVVSAGMTTGGVTITYKNGSTSSVPTYDVRKRVEEIQKIPSGLEVTYTDGTVDEIEITGGGGTSDTGSAKITLVTVSDTVCVYGEPYDIQYRFEAFDSAGDQVGSGAATWLVGGVVVATSTATQNIINKFDVSKYLNPGDNTVKVSISVDTGGDKPLVRTKTWTVNAVDMYIVWDYDETTINTADQVSIRWVPFGEVLKTTHIIIDGNTSQEITSTTSKTGGQQYVTIDRLSHGSHHVVMYCTATINGMTIESETIEHDMIFADLESDVPIIACSVNTATMTQYNTIALPIVIYTPGSLTSDATLAVDGVVTAEWTDIDRTQQIWNYTPGTDGTKILTITSGSTTRTVTINVEPLDIDNEEIGGYSFRLKASDLAGNDALRAWESNGVNATFSDNFDWSNGGIKSETDSDGNLRQYICVKSGTRMTINHQLFADDATVNGKTFKIIFKVRNCRDYDATAATCFSNGIGFTLSAHEALMSSSGRSITVPYGEDEYLEYEFDVYPAPRTANDGNFRYIMAWLDGVITTCRLYGASDNFTHIEPQNIVIGSDDCDVYIYMVKAYPALISRSDHIENFIADAPNAQEMVKRFNRNDILDVSGEINYTKLADKNPDCRVWLYDIPYMTVGKKDKVNGCKFQQIWKNGSQYYQLTGTGTMTVQGTSSVDYLKGAANTDINFTELRDGNSVNLMANGTKDDTYGNNWYVDDENNHGHAKQYTVLDAKVEDGVRKSYTPSQACQIAEVQDISELGAEWIVYSQDGGGNPTLYINSNDTDTDKQLSSDWIVIERDSGGNATKYVKALGYKINDNSCPITYSNTKVNFASCEQVNNMCNAQWYQRFQPVQSRTARDCMEFSMGVQFIKDSGEVPDTSHFVLFGDNKYHMYSIGNMGNSKKNVHVFHDLSNPIEACIEVGNNTNDLCLMVTDDISNSIWYGGSDKSFESRYPDTDTPPQAIIDGWQRFLSWMASSNPNAATGEVLSRAEVYEPYTFVGHNLGGSQVLRGTRVTQYAGTYTKDTFERRMAKMLSECENYMTMDSVVYHFVYLERHTMCDNVAKNSFWSSSDLIHWDLTKAYDMDTSDGNNNEGQMVFDYGNEADDVIGTKTVFNANTAVWFTFISNLYEACQTMFQNRESAGAWSATAYHEFLTSEQKKIPERVWVQCYWYDYLRTYEQGLNVNADSGEASDAWMSFLDGGQKTHQRWHYEYFEEIYDSSKYLGSVCTSNNINFRGYYPTSGWDAASIANWNNLRPKAEVTMKMFNKCYINVSIDGAIYRQKAERGVTYVTDFSDREKLNDTVINLYSAQMIQEVGDMSRLYPGTINFSNAIRLRSLTVGSLTAGYANSNLGSLSFGGNRMLEYLYVQNLGHVTSGLDLTNSISLKYIDATGSSFTSYDFATYGVLETAFIERPVSLTLRDLYLLTSENLHINQFDALDTIRIENCPYIDTLSLINSSANLTRARILGIDWELNETTVLNRMLTILGQDANGFTVPVSVLSGSTYVAGVIRSAELDNYAEAWDNLEITYNPENLIRQYIITYKNYDDTILLKLPVDRGAYPPNPVTQGLIDAPTRPSDNQYIYTYSGWNSLTTIVTEARDVYATYATETRTYTVSWFKRQGDITPLETKSCQYGSSVAYSQEVPAAESNDSLGTYQVFTGWDKSTGYVKDNMNVYGVWESAMYPSEDKELNEMTASEIFAVSAQRKGASRYSIKDYFELEHGHDFNFSNVQSELILENHFFDGTEGYETELQLFKSGGSSFTLAIDYEYLTSCRSNDSLFNCYNPETGDGFTAVFVANASAPASSYPRIRWSNSDQPRRIGMSGQRNVVVLRYIKNSTNLHIYSFNGSTSNDVTAYDENISYVTANGTSIPIVDNKLTFGAVKYTNSGTSFFSNFATGWIHWAKIWYDDLGDDNCRLLASWPHEKTRMEYAGDSRQALAGIVGLSADSSFFSNNLLPLMYRYSSDDYVVSTWEGSLLQKFYEERIFKGLAYKWQSLIKSVQVDTARQNNASNVITSVNHLYPPAYVEVYPSVDPESQYIEENNVGYIPGLFGTSNSLNLSTKWAGFVIDDRNSSTAGRRVITSSADPIRSGYVCEDGDIWCRSSSPKWWVYISPETASKHSIIGTRQLYDTTNSNDILIANDGGLWIRCESWWTRSPDAQTYGQFRYKHYWADYFQAQAYTGTSGLLLGLSI